MGLEVGQRPVGTALLFENDRFRAWSIDLAPGATNPSHFHALDHVLYTVRGATLEIRNATRGAMRRAFEPGVIAFVPAGVTESAVNVGTTRFLSIDIEIKQPSAESTESGRVSERAYGRAPAEGPSGKVVLLETPRVRASQTRIYPGDIYHCAPIDRDQLVVVITDAELELTGPTGTVHEHRIECQAWLRQAQCVQGIRNVGTTLYVELAIELC
jgi:quercetin dioxygenase-like cupin family protein